MSSTSLATTSRRPPLRLILTIVLVLLAHWAVLRTAPVALAAHASADLGGSWAFSTRTLAGQSADDTAAGAPQTVATPPARKPPSRRAVTAEKPLGAGSGDKNISPALVEYTSTATEFVATDPLVEATPATAPILLAAATPVAKGVESDATTTPPVVATPPPAKAVRRFVFAPSTRLKYDIKGEVKGFPYHVNGDLLWVHDGKTYDARMEISHFLLGSRVQTSTGQLTAHGLEPTRFGDKVKSEVAAHFDREKDKVTFSANTPDAPLLPGAQDQLSVLMQLGAMLGGEPHRFPQGTTLPVQAVGPRSAEAWTFTVGVTEKLVLPGGDVSAVRLWRDPQGTYDTKLEVWLAPEAGYLPVRIRLTQANGDVVDQQWRATQKP